METATRSNPARLLWFARSPWKYTKTWVGLELGKTRSFIFYYGLGKCSERKWPCVQLNTRSWRRFGGVEV